MSEIKPNSPPSTVSTDQPRQGVPLPKPMLASVMLAEMTAQDSLWNFIASQESGDLSLDPQDRGNWTSGIVGIGVLKGSKWGISAAAFPLIDIRSVSFDSAKQICMSNYWPAVEGSEICRMGATPIAMLLCDAAWGSGPKPAMATLQRALSISDDGIWGSQTSKTLGHALTLPPRYGLSSGLDVLVAEFVAERIIFESAAATWSRYEGGWVRRMTRIEALVGPLCAGGARIS